VLNFYSDLLERAVFAFSSPISFVTRDQFNKHCQTVFFRTEDYPISTAIIVHGLLEELFQEFKWSEKDPALQQQYSDWAQLCRTNLEISISNLDLLLQPMMESAQALLFAVSIFFISDVYAIQLIILQAAYCMEIGQASVSSRHLPQDSYMI
jgi:hypothetical protein